MAASISRLPTLGGKAAARGAAIMAERPLSDRRQALDRAIILKAAVQKAVESTAQPVRRCDAVIEEITRLRAGLASLYQRDQRLTGEWHRAHHALVDAGRGTCDASNATPDGGTRFGSECKVNRLGRVPWQGDSVRQCRFRLSRHSFRGKSRRRTNRARPH